LRRIKYPNAISSASLLAKEMSYEVIYKAFCAKEMFEKYISKKKLCCESFSLILKGII
jgi:hypothetical protein